MASNYETFAALHVPGDPVIHEFKALALFARGEDARAAAELHTVLAVTTGMDWTTLSGLYPDVETYAAQLRALEDRCQKDPKAAAPHLVLAHHDLVCRLHSAPSVPVAGRPPPSALGSPRLASMPSASNRCFCSSLSES